MANGYQTAAYYFPNWHVDKDNERFHGSGWTEWELLKCARPRFSGHQQPKIPLWGYEDEADPAVMAKKIDTASRYGLDCFLFDWYWFDDRSFLSRCLEEGFLKAENTGKMKFALMFANHISWGNNHPARAFQRQEGLLDGFIDLKRFTDATNYCIEHYLNKENYWRIDGKLYFSFYEISTLIKGLGGMENTRKALDDFRERVRRAGLGELHLNAVLFNVRVLPEDGIMEAPNEQMSLLGMDSCTSYCWAHHQGFDFPTHSFEKISKKVYEDTEKYLNEYCVPYYPNITVGWDPSPRTCQSDIYGNYGYPFTGVLEVTPKQFEEVLVKMKEYLSHQPEKDRIVTVNAWNEWTEGSYLEPDTINKYGYLEALKRVFG